MSTETAVNSRQGLEAYAANGGRHSQILITVALDTRPGRYRSYVEAEQEPLCVSRQPFLDGARKLLARGHDPQTMLIMRWAGAKDWALRGPLGVAAKLTVDDHNGTFAKWKPYSRSAVPAESAKSAKKLPQARAADKATPKSTAEKGRRTEAEVEQGGTAGRSRRRPVVVAEMRAKELRPDQAFDAAVQHIVDA
jgi:hypothetical protein